MIARGNHFVRSGTAHVLEVLQQPGHVNVRKEQGSVLSRRQGLEHQEPDEPVGSSQVMHMEEVILFHAAGSFVSDPGGKAEERRDEPLVGTRVHE